MARFRRVRSVSAALAKTLIGLVVFILVIIGIGIAVLETGWAKNRLRDLIVRQANQYLSATLAIGRLEGSIFRSLTIRDVELSRDGSPLVQIDEIGVSYSIRELVQSGTVIRRLRLTRPRIVGARQRDGRWDLGALVKRESREQQRSGPGRPIEIQSIEIVDGDVLLRDPLDFGAAHVPTHFGSLNASFAFAYYPVRWEFRFNRVAWIGNAPELTVTRLAGGFGRGPGGWFFRQMTVQTPRSLFTLDGRINTENRPTQLDLHVRADRFAFQEWSGVLRGLKNIAVEGSFETSLKGPAAKLETDLKMAANGGAITGHFTLDTTVPGWHGAGAVDVKRLNLARWLNRPDRPSDISGHVTFNLALELGRRFPRGVYTFDGSHAMYLDYAGDNIHARGQITAKEVLVSSATARAYGAAVTTTDGAIGIDEPFPFRFKGTMKDLDMRRVPETVPLPHVESLLALDYDVSGQFTRPFIIGDATFGPSQFLGAAIGAGTVGSVDTSQKPLHFAGDGEVDGLDVRRFGEGLGVGWMQDERYAGTIAGHFRVDGVGTDRDTLALTGGGRLTRADMFRGTLSDADVSIDIARGTLQASYNGRLSNVDPSVPFADPRFQASLTGTGSVNATVRDLLTAEHTTLGDYDVKGTLSVEASTVRGLQLDRGTVDATLAEARLTIARLELAGPAIEGSGSGTIGFTDEFVNDFQYNVVRADLAGLHSFTRQDIAGVVSTQGRVTGPSTALHLIGDATLNQLDAFNVTALTLSGHYDVTLPLNDTPRATARITGQASFLTIFGQSILDASGTITFDSERVGFDLRLVQAQGRNGGIAGSFLLRTDRREIELQELTIALGRAPWRLVTASAKPLVRWSDDGISVTSLQLVGGSGDERIGVSGTWQPRGGGELHVTAAHVFLETLQGAFERPTRYGGVVDADVTIGGTREIPLVTGQLSVTNGRVERVTYQKLGGSITYSNRVLTVDMRLDQSPGVWITAAGTLPISLFNRDLPEAPINVAIKSSSVSLGLVEGVTDVIRNVTGELLLNVNVIGTSRDPHFDGTIQIANAGFLVSATGVRYKNARASVILESERVTVESLHLEDNGGRPLDVRGSLGTHELKVGDVEIDATARRIDVLRNALGNVNVDATLRIRGRFENPRVIGDVTIGSSELKVDEILQRTLFQPYSTQETVMTEIDAVVALNPWERLGLDISLHVPDTLRLAGSNVQVSPGTPVGLGDINLRVAGDLSLYKDPGEQLYVTGSFDSVSGTYSFQGRRFDVIPTSSINFRGDLNPDIYVTVTRIISGVEVRVSIIGPLQEPELRLSSTPPLEASDVLSLIVFNTSTNQLSTAQQQELVVRAGALAAGFLTAPLVSALESQLGLDILELDPTGEFGVGPRVTIGQELAPGLVARFSRQFGPNPYDEATIEYYLSRLLRLRATFSDAQTLNFVSPFRRVERAGIDLLFFFSF